MPNPTLISLCPNWLITRSLDRRKRVVGLFVCLVLAVAGMSLSGSLPAQAANVPGGITSVTITPTDPVEGAQITTDMDWAVPPGTKTGDTFTLTLPIQLTGLPAGFTLREPRTGAAVATAALSGSSPDVMTFTMTSYAETHADTKGTAFIQSSFNPNLAPSGVPTAFTSTTGDNRAFTTEVTPTGVVRNHGEAVKYGSFTRPDQGRTNPVDFLTYHVDTPLGPFTSAVTTDAQPTGEDWLFDCSTLNIYDATVGATAIVPGAPVTTAAVTCSTTSLTIDWPSEIAGHLFRADITVSIPAATGLSAPPETFVNTAHVTTTGTTPYSGNVTAATAQASAGGTGGGNALTPGVSITKGDSNGNAANTAATAAVLGSSGTASLIYTITNTGTDALTDISVSDDVLSNGAVTGLSCNFSKLGGPSTGVTWSGPFAAGASFECTSSLSGVKPGVDHEDLGRVVATGVVSGTPVFASNAYFARVPAAAVTNTASTGGSSGTVTLAYTGSNPGAPLGLAGLLVALGIGSLVVGRRRQAR